MTSSSSSISNFYTNENETERNRLYNRIAISPENSLNEISTVIVGYNAQQYQISKMTDQDLRLYSVRAQHALTRLEYLGSKLELGSDNWSKAVADWYITHGKDTVLFLRSIMIVDPTHPSTI